MTCLVYINYFKICICDDLLSKDELDVTDYIVFSIDVRIVVVDH